MVSSPDRRVVLVGANPGMRLFDGDAVVAFASCWRVDWSTHGSGSVIVLWQPDRVSVVGENRELATWLADDFVRHFPELDGVPWHEPEHVQQPVDLTVDLERGASARSALVTVDIGDVLDRRAFATDDFPLGAVIHSLSLVIAPCESGSISVGGVALAGAVRLDGTPDRPGSSAFVTDAEVWRA
ncbi:MAG: hypothetical protein ABJB03_03640 [Rhodoglobus sp.]